MLVWEWSEVDPVRWEVKQSNLCSEEWLEKCVLDLGKRRAEESGDIWQRAGRVWWRLRSWELEE